MSDSSTSARYRISHRTEYEYSEPVALCQNQLRLTPRSLNRYQGQVQCDHTALTIEPEPDSLTEHTDYFGNQVHSFSIESLHRRLSVTATSEVTVSVQRACNDAKLSWEEVKESVTQKRDPDWLEANEYCYDSPRIRLSDDFAQYARQSFTAGRDLIDAGLDLTKRIHDEFTYDTHATDVDTETEKAFRLRAGVCQDFAHIQIACLRSIGLPARYVSGYLRTHPPAGEQKMVGADESHAWTSLYGGGQLGWIDFDPTNACLADTNHISVCVGRDYSDVTPMRGVVTGGGATDLVVSVGVVPLDIEQASD